MKNDAVKTGCRRRAAAKESGFSLMELIVAIGLFSIVVLTSTQVVTTILESQRSSAVTQQLQQNMRYFFEIMSKEVRMAQKSGDECEDLFTPPASAENKVYNVTEKNGEDALYFKNQYGECVAYYVSADDVLMIKREDDEASTTPAGLEVKDVEFTVEDIEIGEFLDTQPKVTVFMELGAGGDHRLAGREMRLQTTISSRYYE